MSTGAPIKLAVLVSGGGTTLQNLIDRIADGMLNAQICLVIASRPGIAAIERAAKARLMNFVVDPREMTDLAEFSRKVFALCDDAGVDLVCLAGWLSLLDVPERYVGRRAMNIHPALLPSPFGGKGMYGQRVHEAVLAAGCKVSGCTVHLVDNDYDSGPIVIQETCRVLDDDTPETLAHRVAALEHACYPEAIRLFAEGRLKVEGRRVRVLPERDASTNH